MNERDIEKLILDFHWMVNELKRLEGTHKMSESSLTIGFEKRREEIKMKRLLSCKKNIETVMSFYEYLQDDKETVIFDCMLEGVSLRKIANILGVSATHVHRMKDRMIKRIYLRLSEQ